MRLPALARSTGFHGLTGWKGINAENNDKRHESFHHGSEHAFFPPWSGYYHYSLFICCSSSSENARWQAWRHPHSHCDRSVKQRQFCRTGTCTCVNTQCPCSRIRKIVALVSQEIPICLGADRPLYFNALLKPSTSTHPRTFKDVYTAHVSLITHTHRKTHTLSN